jgi:anti-sigma factor RsiW
MKLSENELHAYLDDQLDGESRRAIEAHLAQTPEDAARVAAYREQNAALHAAFDPVLDEPVPDRLRHIDTSRRAARVAVAAGWFAAGIFIGWFANAVLTDWPHAAASFPRQAAIAHAVYSPEVRHPVEVGAAEQEHLVNWLSKRLGTKLKVPLLTAEGYELVGGRLLPGEGGAAVAQFMYQDAKGKRLTLYVSRLPGKQRDTAFRFSQEEKVSVFYWIDGALGYALSGELPKAELLNIATTVYKQLNP